MVAILILGGHPSPTTVPLGVPWVGLYRLNRHAAYSPPHRSNSSVRGLSLPLALTKQAQVSPCRLHRPGRMGARWRSGTRRLETPAVVVETRIKVRAAKSRSSVFSLRRISPFCNFIISFSRLLFSNHSLTLPPGPVNLPHMDTPRKRDLHELASLLEADPGWLGAVLTILDVGITQAGQFDPADVCKALDSAARKMRPVGRDEHARRQMGKTKLDCLVFLRDRLKAQGLEPKIALQGQYRIFIKTTDGRSVLLPVYVAWKENPPGQVRFTISNLLNEDLDWFGLVAWPFGKVFLTRRREILARRRTTRLSRSNKKTVTVTLGHEDDLLENRILELQEGR